jgi:integrase/recombinase XerD
MDTATEPLHEQFLSYYAEYHGLTGKRAGDIATQVRAFAAFVNGDISKAVAQDFENYARLLVQQGMAPNTVRTYLGCIRPMLKWAARNEHISMVELLRMQEVKPPKGADGKARPRPYSTRELRDALRRMHRKYPYGSREILVRFTNGTSTYNRVWKHATRLQMEAVFYIALHAGLRINEIYMLELDDLHPDNQSIIVRHAKGDERGSKIRSVPMTNTVREKIRRWLKMRALILKVCAGGVDPGPLWLSLWPSSGGPMAPDHRPWDPISATSFKGMLAKVDVQAHRLRHTAGTTWLRAGMPVEQVQMMLGHSSISQTMGYLRIAEQDLAKTMTRAQGAFEKALDSYTVDFEEPEFETERERRALERWERDRELRGGPLPAPVPMDGGLDLVEG